jgi:pimeloyl-ACP methyl ester carboxylesterase
VPLLVVHGTADPRVPYDQGRRAFDEWRGPKSFLTLLDALHSAHVEDPDSPHGDVVIEGTTLFWDAIVREDASAASRLAQWSPPWDLARFEK